MTQLDGEGMRQMEMFEANRVKEQQKKHMLLSMAHSTGQSIHELTGAHVQAHTAGMFDLFGDQQAPTEHAHEQDEWGSVPTPRPQNDSDESDGGDEGGPDLGPTLTVAPQAAAIVVPQAPEIPPHPVAVQALVTPTCP